MKIKAMIKNLNLEFDSEKGIPTQVIGDKLRLQQIMINLVQNAITYTTEGSVKVSVSYME
jgi:signal transduction histidine kinase